MDMAAIRGKQASEAGGGANAPVQQFNLLRRFSLVSLVIIGSVALGEMRHHGLEGMEMGDVPVPHHCGMLTRSTAESREIEGTAVCLGFKVASGSA